jgi:hypothetical protein
MKNTEKGKNIFLLLVIGSSLSLIATTSNSVLFPGGQIGITQETKATTEIQNTSTIANKTLGNPFYEESTKSTGIRVVDVSHGPKIEISFAGNGTINGTIAVTDIGTIWTLPTSPDGMNLYSQGQGILTTEQGAMTTYTQQASGEITSDGRVLFQGSMFFSASPSQTGELAFLDNLVGVYTYESDLAGNAERVVWEWT